MNGKNRAHDWRKLKWPFTVTFLYYALLSLFTGYSEAGEAGFLSVLIVALLVDAFAYFLYCFVLSREKDDMHKLWYVFLLVYALLTVPQLRALWGRLRA